MKVLDKSYEGMLKILGVPCKVTSDNGEHSVKGIFVKHPDREVIYFLSNSVYFAGSYPSEIVEDEYRFGWFCVNKTGNFADALFKDCFSIEAEIDVIDYGEL